MEAAHTAAYGSSTKGVMHEAVPDLESLSNRLDELWGQYLEFLDCYEKAQHDLRKDAAAGFFSIAQANFKSPNRRQYGQDFYDQRMKASKCCAFREGDERAALLRVEIAKDESASDSADSDERPPTREPQQQPSPPSTPGPENLTEKLPTAAEPSADKNETSNDSKNVRTPQDPLHWYGILIPRELRSAQASFSAALDGPVIQAVNAARGMRVVEDGIRQVRKAAKKVERGAAT